MTLTTSWASVASKQPPSNGRSSAGARVTCVFGSARLEGRDEFLGRVDRRDPSRPGPPGELGGQRTGAASDVEDPAVERESCEIGEGHRQRPRVAAHEPVIGIGIAQAHFFSSFALARAYRLAARILGIRPATAWVDVGNEALDARLGPWRLSTRLANVTDVAVTGPYAFWKTAGPARLAITDRGLTFATNGDRGVRISFHTPVRGLDPLGILRHPELTVTVSEVDRLAELLRTKSGTSAAG